jgi:hypothetical protein
MTVRFIDGRRGGGGAFKMVTIEMDPNDLRWS